MNLIIIVALLIITTSSASAVGTSTYYFSQSGYSENAFISGLIVGIDKNNDGWLTSRHYEISDFHLEFSGNSKVPAFTEQFSPVSYYAYKLDTPILGDDSATLQLSYLSIFVKEQIWSIFGDNRFEYKSDQKSVAYCPPAGRDYFDYTIQDLKIVTPTPVPAAVWLFGSGLVGLVGLKKKRAKK